MRRCLNFVDVFARKMETRVVRLSRRADRVRYDIIYLVTVLYGVREGALRKIYVFCKAPSRTRRVREGALRKIYVFPQIYTFQKTYVFEKVYIFFLKVYMFSEKVCIFF